jgi:hypothetical protein
MSEKYDLKQLLKEIEEDRLADRSEKRKMAQGQIQEIITKRKEAGQDAASDRPE